MSRRSSIIATSLALLGVPVLVGAADLVKLNLSYPTFGGLNLEHDQNLVQILGWLYYAMISISGLAAFAMLVWGGVQWLTSSGNPGQIGDARDKITQALLGLAIVLGSYLIVGILNPELQTLQSPNVAEIQKRTYSFRQSGLGLGRSGGSAFMCTAATKDMFANNLPSQYCKPEALAPYFNQYPGQEKDAAIICQFESNGSPFSYTKQNCLNSKDPVWGYEFSVGLFQTNLLAHCPQAFIDLTKDTSAPTNCAIRDMKVFSQCLARFGFNGTFDESTKEFTVGGGVDPTTQIVKAKEIFTNTASQNRYPEAGWPWCSDWKGSACKTECSVCPRSSLCTL